MDTHVVYCSACDREIRVAFPAEPTDTVAAMEVDPRGICIDFCSNSCTGSICALFDGTPEEMKARLEASGLLNPAPPAGPRLTNHEA
jgi:hypothetical protein